MYWFGDHASYDAVGAAKTKLSAAMKGSGKNSLFDFELPPMYTRDGDVGMIQISGSLIEGEAGWMRLFGVTGYEDVSNAVLQGIQDKGAKSLLYVVNSPGGQVNGVSAAGDMIHNAAQVKPSSVYATSMIASAAYWLGAAAGHITLDEASIAGSLGVIYVYTNYEKALAQDGVSKTVIRAGKYKQELNPYEPPTEEAIAHKQEQLDQLHTLFLSAVADYRGGTAESVNNRMGEGREYLGARAKEVGLVDKIGTIQDAFVHAKGMVAGFKPVKAINL